MRVFCLFKKITATILLLTALRMQAQTISFRITLWGDSIGRMDVNRSTDNAGNEVFSIESKSSAKFLWIVRNGYSKFEAVYKNGKLISCTHIETENKKTKRTTSVKLNGSSYQVTSLENGNSSFTETPLCSDASIYFTEVKNLSRIFYLPDAHFYPLKQTGAHTLEFKSADGHRNVYLFENGKIKGMEFHLPLVSVYMQRIK
jgi:hypothetical protein